MYTLKLALIVLGSIVQSIPMIALGLVDPDGKRVYPMFRFWSWCVLKTGGVRLKARDTSRLDPRQAYVFMANHQSNIDIPVLVQALAPFQTALDGEAGTAPYPVLRLGRCGLPSTSSSNVHGQRTWWPPWPARVKS